MTSATTPHETPTAMPTVEEVLWLSGDGVGVELEVLMEPASTAAVAGACKGFTELVEEAVRCADCEEVEVWLDDVVRSADEEAELLLALLPVPVNACPDSCLMPIVVKGNAGCSMEMVEPNLGAHWWFSTKQGSPEQQYVLFPVSHWVTCPNIPISTVECLLCTTVQHGNSLSPLTVPRLKTELGASIALPR